jgi:hypothetical protein
MVSQAFKIGRLIAERRIQSPGGATLGSVIDVPMDEEGRQ